MIDRRAISATDTIQVGERMLLAAAFVCPSCDVLWLNLDIDERGEALWRVTCPAEHTWDVYPTDAPKA